MEDEIPKRIDGVIDAINLVEQKNEAYKHNVLASLHGLEEELDRAAQLLAHPPTEPRGFLDALSEGLLHKKPLTNIEQSNKNFYKYISKLGKRVESLKKLSDGYLNLYGSEFDKKALNEAIAHYVFSFAVESGAGTPEIDFRALCGELGLGELDDLVKKFEGLTDVRAIQADLAQRNLEPLKNWVFLHLPKLLELQSPLPLMTYEFYIVHRVENRRLGFKEALRLARTFFQELYDAHKPQIDQFMAFLVLWNIFSLQEINTESNEPQIQNRIVEPSEPDFFNFAAPAPPSDFFALPPAPEAPTRPSARDFFAQNYAHYLNLDWDALDDVFAQEAYKVLRIARSDPLFEVFRAGVATYPQFQQFVDLLNAAGRDEEALGVSLELGEEFSFHTQVVCPVSKEVCSKDNPPVALSCGHIISDVSARKLAQIRSDISAAKKFKCPVCPEEQTYTRVRVLKLD